jgi:hypothetical protein
MPAINDGDIDDFESDELSNISEQIGAHHAPFNLNQNSAQRQRRAPPGIFVDEIGSNPS